jgi:carbonic anhydrase
VSTAAPHPVDSGRPAAFAVVVTCIDGRIQETVQRDLRLRHRVDFVDVVTWPGVDAVLADDDGTAGLLAAIEVSLTAHDACCVVVAGHTDCAANPVDEATHESQVAAAVTRLSSRLGERAHVHGMLVDTAGGSLRPVAGAVTAGEGAS